MNATTRRHFCAMALACTGMHAMNAFANSDSSIMAAGPTFSASGDSEKFHTRRTGVDFFPTLTSQGSAAGLRYRHHEFWQDGWSQDGEQLSVIAKGDQVAGAQAWQAEAGAMKAGRHTLLTLDGNYVLPISNSTSTEFFINRDFVETKAALDEGIHFTFAGASVEQQIHPKLTLVPVAGYQRFSDGNRRKHGRVRLIFQPDLDMGLTFQYRYRYYSSSQDIAPTYFNPERYRENMLLTGWRSRHGGWVSSMLAGFGMQKITDLPNEPTRLLEVSLESPAAGSQSLALRAGYLQSAAFGGPDYRYRYVQVNWAIRF